MNDEALAAAFVPRRNLCAEFSQLPTDQLLVEAEAMLTRLNLAGRPTDYAIVVAMVRRLQKPKMALESAIWLDVEPHAPAVSFSGVERRHG